MPPKGRGRRGRGAAKAAAPKRLTRAQASKAKRTQDEVNEEDELPAASPANEPETHEQGPGPGPGPGQTTSSDVAAPSRIIIKFPDDFFGPEKAPSMLPAVPDLVKFPEVIDHKTSQAIATSGSTAVVYGLPLNFGYLPMHEVYIPPEDKRAAQAQMVGLGLSCYSPQET